MFEKFALLTVLVLYKFANFLLGFLSFLLFWRRKIHADVKKVVIFRVGNIGDMVCAVPSMETIKKNFPKAKIILLSSSGKRHTVGAKELLENAEFLDNLITYYQEDIRGLRGIYSLVKKLREEKCDLFIELPPSLAKFKTLVRNMIFVKLIGVKYAFGFQMSSVMLFRQIQSKSFRCFN